MRIKPLLAPLALAAAIAPAMTAAHPHIFVDLSLSLRIDDQGQLLGVEVTWAYDDFYSLLIFEDRALDNDFDGELNAPELQQLQGFDLNWSDGFEGDTYVTRSETPLALAAPQPLSTEVRAGRITTTHFRPLAEPQDVDGLTIQIYDPTYYTAYDLEMRVQLPTATNCVASVQEANLDQAYTLVEESLYSLSTAEAEDAFPEIGQSFADTVRISCAHGS
ncbi:DUF1007 family protein [Epibacterium ulvae]|uniref:DUF1007 family protein n=1 Tax=Epibacterium ulvae TaxID=1156985 RepID=UPI001BFCABFA|nr:DUF1007 family protein [Epibacterium ulvae]MBT8152975.1 DUF1007 family protein [Epibacterium ulvae]